MTNGKFVASYRISTERQGRSGLGLDARREAVMRHLSAGGWPAWPSSPRSRRRVRTRGPEAIGRQIGNQLMSATRVVPADSLRYQADGAQLHRAAADDGVLQEIVGALAGQPEEQAGVRLFGVTALRPFLEPTGVMGAIVASILGPGCRPVRALLFDKTSSANWSLGWHQDRVIAVEDRIEVEGFGPWTRKHGALHVAPPFDLLARMVTLRLHLDDVPVTNAPLLVAPGSHRLGRIAEADVPAVVQRCGVVSCIAAAGDVWLYATPILHASEATAHASHRRVVQVDYAVGDLPGGLRWLGI